MVICGMVVGVILWEIRYPAKILPRSRRLMELTKRGLFSLMIIAGLKRGCPRSAKNTIRVL